MTSSVNTNLQDLRPFFYDLVEINSLQKALKQERSLLESKDERTNFLLLQKKNKVTELEDCENSLRLLNAELKDLEKTYLIIERDLTQAKGALKMASNEKQMEGGQHQVDVLSERLSDIEERTLELMQSIEDENDKASELNGFLQGFESTFSEIKEEVDSEKTEVCKKITNIEDRIKALFNNLNKDFKQIIHPKLKVDLASSCIAFTKSGACSACGKKIEKSQIIEIDKAKHIEQCSLCQRVLIPYLS